MKNITWRTEKRKLADLVPASYNPRKLTEKQYSNLKESLEKFGLAEIPAINTDNLVLAGHQRLKVLTDIFGKDHEIDVRIPNRKLTDAEAKEYNIRSNKNTGEWDWDMMANNFDVTDLIDWGFEESELVGFDLFEEEEKDDQVSAVSENPRSKLGDLYEIGGHRVLCGDSTKKEDIGKLLAGSRAKMCFTDPPYNVDYQGGMGTHKQNKREGIQNDKMTKDDFKDFLYKALVPILENTDGGIYVCMSSSELDSLKDGFEKAGGHWQSFIIWVKNNFTLSRADYQNTYEPILYGWKDGIVNHYFTERRDIANVWEDLSEVKTEFDGKNTTISFSGFKVKIEGKVDKGEVIRKKQSTDIWRYDKPTKSSEHPTMKPVSLVVEAISNSSKRGDVVLDTFLGSGSTLIASEKTGRVCYGIELDPKYVDVIVQRYVDFVEDPKVVKNGVDETEDWEKRTK